MDSSPSALKAFFIASRPRTWIAGISPVLIGAVLAFRDGPCSIQLFLCTLFFSLFVQIGTNFANDYFDFIKGADNEKRIGPPRAVSMGWIAPQLMKNTALLFFLAAFAISIPLVQSAGLWTLLFVISSIAFGILYTGGPRPLGYLGLGELLVLAYFGPVAVLGTYYVQRHTLSLEPFLLSFTPGLLSSAILIANNLRDEHTDREAKKNTLVVRWGRSFGQIEYTVSIAAAAIIPLAFGYTLAPFCLIFALPLIRRVFSYRQPAEIIPLLPQTALLLILFTAAFCIESLK